MPKVPDPDEPSTLRPIRGPMLNVPSSIPGTSGTGIGNLGKYRLLKQLGAGGMGAVYLAEDTALQRAVAIKTLLPNVAEVPEYKDRFLREARSAAAIKHENVITIYSVEEIDGIPLLVMERLKGQSLEEFLRKGGKLGPLQITRIGRETAQGLKAAHERGMIHRDIKPANIWLEAPKGKVKVLDFGLAVRPNQDLRLSVSGAVLGTPCYMAPEQARGLPVDPRADLFSLGVMLYQLCTGRRPFDGDSMMAILLAVATTDPPPPSTLSPDVPPAMDTLVMRLISKDPAGRPASADEVIAALAKPMAWADSGNAPGTDIPPAPSAIHSPSANWAPTLVPLDTLPPTTDPLAFPTAQPLDDPPPPVPLDLDAPRRRRWPMRVAALVLVAGAVAGFLFREELFGSAAPAVPVRPTGKPELPAPPPTVPTVKADVPKPADPAPPPPPKYTGPVEVILEFQNPELGYYFRDGTKIGLEPPLAKGLKLSIDGSEVEIFRRLQLKVGPRHIRFTIRGVEVHAATETVKTPDEGKTIIRVPLLDDPDAKATVILAFAKTFTPAQAKNLEMFVDGKPHKPFAIPDDLKLSLQLLPGDHRVSFNYRGIEVLDQPMKVRKPSAGSSIQPVDPVIDGTIRLSANRPVARNESVWVAVDGVEMNRMWKRGDSSWEFGVEVGEHKIRVWMTTPNPKVREVDTFPIEVRSGKTTTKELKF